MPRKYVELLHDLQRGLLSSSDQHSLELDLLQPNLQQEDQVHRVYLAEARAQVTFEWTVLECVWKGTVDSFLSRREIFPSLFLYIRLYPSVRTINSCLAKHHRQICFLRKTQIVIARVCREFGHIQDFRFPYISHYI